MNQSKIIICLTCVASLISLGIFLLDRILDLMENFAQPEFSVPAIFALGISYVINNLYNSMKFGKILKWLSVILAVASFAYLILSYSLMIKNMLIADWFSICYVLCVMVIVFLMIIFIGIQLGITAKTYESLAMANIEDKIIKRM